MKREFIFCSLLGLCCLFANDLASYKDLTKLSSSTPIFTENFNGGANAWTLPKGWNYVPREGITGSGALKYIRKNPKDNTEATINIPVQAHIRYRLTLQYRSELKVEANKKRMENFAIRYWDENGKKLPGSFYNQKKMNSNNNDWDFMEFSFQPPKGVKTAKLCLLMRVERTGTLWFDDIVITPVSSEIAMLHMIGPQKLTLNEYGEVSWKCYAPTVSKNIKLAVQANVGNRVKRLPLNKYGIAKGSFGKFKNGKIPVEAKLLDLTNKRILAVDKANLFARGKKNYSVPHNVEIDAFNRVIVGGKPFMPIGLFSAMIVEMKDTKALKQIKDAGFNTLLSIGYVNPYGGIKESPEKTLLALCNELKKHDLKYIFSIKNQVELPKHKKKRGRYHWGQYKTKNQVTAMTVKTLRNHPAMLAWYISDENSLDEIPNIRALRERISQLDPYHPILTLTDKVANFQHFAKTGDVLMHDVYPIGWRKNNGPAQSLITARNAFGPAKDVSLPLWWVPQAFPWIASSLENLSRNPTEEEMTSQCLLAAIHGVKAFILYSWQHAIYLSEKNDPGHSKKLWKDISKTVSVLKSLEPFIMSLDKAPSVKVKNITGKGVEAAAFRYGDKICVLIVSIGPGNAKSEIIIPGCSGLKSKLGRTKNLGNGRYMFTGKHIQYDILEIDPN